jgi:hypothetical protein
MIPALVHHQTVVEVVVINESLVVSIGTVVQHAVLIKWHRAVELTVLHLPQETQVWHGLQHQVPSCAPTIVHRGAS